MKSILVTALGVALISTITGCAAPTTRAIVGTKSDIDAEARYQRELALQQVAESRIRLYDVFSKLRVSASELCEKNVSPFVGIYYVQPEANENGAALKKLYKLGDAVSILHVADGSPAKLAGLQQGDSISAIGGKSVVNIADMNAGVEATLIGQPLSIEYVHSGEKKVASVTPLAGCKYDATINPSMEFNAFADGKSVTVTQGMMNFAQTEEELALVVSHEIAHNLMKHIDAKKTNALGGLLGDVALAVLTRGAYRNANMANAAAQAYSQEFESEADYVGLYIMARAGYRIEDAPKFWRRMAVAHPGNIKTNHAASHPSTASRMVALEAAVTEIKAKQAAKEPLTPNLKEARVAATVKPQ